MLAEIQPLTKNVVPLPSSPPDDALRLRPGAFERPGTQVSWESRPVAALLVPGSKLLQIDLSLTLEQARA
jgi:hypothetical protein